LKVLPEYDKEAFFDPWGRPLTAIYYCKHCVAKIGRTDLRRHLIKFHKLTFAIGSNRDHPKVAANYIRIKNPFS